MSRLAACAIVAIPSVMAATAWGQSREVDRLVTTRAASVYASPGLDEPAKAMLAQGQTVYFLELDGAFARIDASGVAGPAYISQTDIERVRRLGVCDCSGDVSPSGRCGARSSYCRSGGNEPAVCRLDSRNFAHDCRPASVR